MTDCQQCNSLLPAANLYFCRMFTGIVETLGTLVSVTAENDNKSFWIQSPISQELKVDQSIAHDGICLTVVELKDNLHRVTAVKETLDKSNIGQWQPNHKINLERCLKADGRFDGHIVQGHVDATAILSQIDNQNGSFKLHFTHNKEAGITVKKGSICLNGISLTVVDSEATHFSVVIIPYTWEQTNLGLLKIGETVNVEFDIVGKYMQKIMNG